jgi:hypothetical protein
MDRVQDFHLSQLSGALQQPSLQVEAVHAFQIESQADETPFACCRQLTAQRELAKAEDLLDDANDGFNGAFSQSARRGSPTPPSFLTVGLGSRSDTKNHLLPTTAFPVPSSQQTQAPWQPASTPLKASLPQNTYSSAAPH